MGYQSMLDYYLKVSPSVNGPMYTRPVWFILSLDAEGSVVWEAHRGLKAHGRLLDYLLPFFYSLPVNNKLILKSIEFFQIISVYIF